MNQTKYYLRVQGFSQLVTRAPKLHLTSLYQPVPLPAYFVFQAVFDVEFIFRNRLRPGLYLSFQGQNLPDQIQTPD